MYIADMENSRELDKDVSYQWDCTPEEHFDSQCF